MCIRDSLKEANTGDFSQYRFWQYVPDDKDAPDRFLKCEGYLFPDTYDLDVYKRQTWLWCPSSSPPS